MALIDCTECGKQISSKAASCPHCGAPNESAEQRRDNPAPKTTRRAGGVFEGIGFLLILGGIFAGIATGGAPAGYVLGFAGFVVFLIGRFM